MLDRAELMHLPLGGKVGGVSGLFGSKNSDVVRLPGVVNARPPSVEIRLKDHAKKPALVVFLATPKVLLILGWRGFSKVLEAVVRLVAINMVNVVLWPFSRHVEPSKSMGSVKNIFNPDYRVASLICVAGHIANLNSMRATNAPSEYARLGVVMQEFAQSLCAKIGLSHEAVLSLIGQRPACVSSTCGLRYFNAEVA